VTAPFSVSAVVEANTPPTAVRTTNPEAIDVLCEAADIPVSGGNKTKGHSTLPDDASVQRREGGSVKQAQSTSGDVVVASLEEEANVEQPANVPVSAGTEEGHDKGGPEQVQLAEISKPETEQVDVAEGEAGVPATSTPADVEETSICVAQVPSPAEGGNAELPKDGAVLPDGGSAPSMNLRSRPKSPPKVKASAHSPQCASVEVNPGKSLSDLMLCKRGGNSSVPPKLLILNVHGTLVACSLLEDRNPNPRIRCSAKTNMRRVIFRPWLKTFLARCFGHFTVAFWGGNSDSYLLDVLPTMLAGLKGVADPTPLFAWCDKSRSVEQVSDTENSMSGKNLGAVYARWPVFNAENTFIVDSKSARVACNPDANVLINPPFYVKWIRSLADDKDYLKCYLWPLLEALWKCSNVSAFRAKYPQIVNESMAQMIQKRRSRTPYEFLDLVEGEGTCKPRRCVQTASPHLHFIIESDCRLFVRRPRHKRRTAGGRTSRRRRRNVTDLQRRSEF
jgi:hypothetical protein